MNKELKNECLASMKIIVDTREQENKRAERRYSAFGCEWYKQKLDYGDYTFNFTLPDGEEWFDSDCPSVPGDVVIERKENLAELSGNLFQNRERFVRELERAKSAGAKVYLLVEDASWDDVVSGKYRTNANPKAYLASLEAFMARYDIHIVFCSEKNAGLMIHDILYRELKERLDRGHYDCLIWN